jgi:CheY-like chemotaxis protein/nitrogen-specific signal transduction histidine kinase/HPt (histidine-containing phosphotransfer) domain-containing protein
VLWTGYWVDVTEEKRQGAALAAAKEEAESATRAKSAFLAAMSHEIRTPMNGILGMLEILSLSRLDAEQAESLATIRDSARALLRIIDDILDFSKLEAARMTVEERPIDLTEAIESVVQLFVSNARSKGLRLRCFVDASISAPVMGDSVRLGQVLSNLLSNAIKFTEHGGITVTAALEENVDSKRSVRIMVADTGIGVSPEARARLFQPFMQAETSTSRRFGGTGLGLTISQGLVQMMGGNIEMQSGIGEGTRVTVTLPYVPVAIPVTPASDLDAVRVLLATDDAEESRFFPRYFESSGATVRSCSVQALPDVSRAATEGNPSPYDVVVCQDSALGRVRSALATSPPDGLPGKSKSRFVTLSEEAAAFAPRVDSDAVRVPTLSRARIIAAVAIAAGRDPLGREAMEGPESTPPFRKPPTVEEAAARGRLILLVEDHPTNQQVILRQLNLLGFAAELAENGKVALEKWKSGRFALVLTDCHMPEMDGYELARMIRAAERTTTGKHTPIIALTANALKGEGERCLAVGMDDYLAKPVQMATIQARLKKWLPEEPGDAEVVAAPLDAGALTGMFGEDEKTISGVLRDFLKENEKDVVELEAAIAGHDADKVMHAAHRIKGAARIIGAYDLADASYRLELAARDQELTQISDLCGSFFARLNAVARYIRARY